MKTSEIRTGRTFFELLLYVIALVLYCLPAHAGTALLTWQAPTTNVDGTPLTDLAGYRVYYGTSSGAYTSTVDVGNTTSFQAQNLTEGVTYYFAVTDYTTNLSESGFSGEVSKTIPLSQNPPSGGSSGTGGSGSLSWGTWSGDPARDNTINFYGNDYLCPYGDTCTYQWDFGDPASGTADVATDINASHTYPGSAYYTVTLVVTANNAGTTTSWSSPIFVNTKPIVSHGPMTVNGYTVSFADTSQSTDGIAFPPGAVKVNWGDGVVTIHDAGTIITHTYTRVGVFTIYHTVTDAGDSSGYGKLLATEKFTATVPQKFTVSGTVSNRYGVALAGVTLSLRKNGFPVAAAKSAAGNGSFNFANVKPGTYTIMAYKFGYRFTWPVAAKVSVIDTPVTVNITAK